MTKKAILITALVGALYATVSASLVSAVGYADRIAVREGYSQYEGKVDLRDATGAVNFYFWGGTRCAAAPDVPTDREVDLLLNAHLSGHSVSIDYNEYSSSYGQSRCWDGGLQVY
jgi:hypothetical protein